MLAQLMSQDFMPHGYCYLWDPWILWLHVLSDGLIVLAYYSIPIALVTLVRKRHDLPFNWVFWIFSLFIVGCGTTHLMEIWTVWHGSYLLSGLVKAFTAVVSVATAVVLFPLVPKAVALPSLGQLHAINRELESQIAERTRTARQLRETLEQRERAFADLAREKSTVADLRRVQTALRESEERFRGVIESAMDAIITINEQHRIVMFNRAAETVFGCPAEQALGTNTERFVPQRYRSAHASHIRKFAQTGITSRRMSGVAGLWALRSDGTEFPIEASISQVTAGGEKLLSVILRDITERRNVEAANLRLAAIVESSTDAIISKDLNGIIISWNQGAQQMFGYSAQEIVGHPVARLIPPGRQSEENDILERVRRGERVQPFETVRLRKDGKEIQVSAAASPVKDAAGRVIGASKIARDITEQKRVQAELQKQRAELARSNSDLEQFAYAASHDLQEPLRAVAGCVHLLQARYGDQLDERAHEYMYHAVEGAARMQNLIDDLLSFSRLGTHGKKFQAVACESALENALKNLSVAIREKQAEIEHDPLPVVSGDLSQLSLLFQNLIGNALKFCGAETPRIHIGAQDRQNEWEISVRDNGIGINPEYFQRIFVIFQRLHTRKDYPGTGMGLALCKKIVERHGGRIWVESESGEGTTFRFTLPAPQPSQGRVVLEE